MKPLGLAVNRAVGIAFVRQANLVFSNGRTGFEDLSLLVPIRDCSAPKHPTMQQDRSPISGFPKSGRRCRSTDEPADPLVSSKRGSHRWLLLGVEGREGGAAFWEG